MLEQKPHFANYSAQFQVLVLIDILKYYVFSNLSFVLASYFSLFQNGHHQSHSKIANHSKRGKFSNFIALWNFRCFECSAPCQLLLDLPNSNFSARIRVINNNSNFITILNSSRLLPSILDAYAFTFPWKQCLGNRVWYMLYSDVHFRFL